MSSTPPDARAQGTNTRVIAHRGASGYLPEHTLAAKAFAYGLGCDFIEQDLIATRDEQLVVLHDIYLDDVSDVASRAPGRARADGHYYVVDFTFDELKEFRLAERRQSDTDTPRFPGRFPYLADGFRVVQFEDEVRLVSGLNATTGRHVGIYPEIKAPDWHAAEGIDITALVHQALEHAREILSGPVFVQSFDSAALIRLRDEFASSWPRVRLLNERDVAGLVADPGGLSRIAEYAVAVGLPYQTLLELDGAGGLTATPFARQLVDTDLLVHPYTLRRDEAPLAGVDYFAALRFLIRELKVDGLFCDQPDDAIAIRDYTTA